MFYQNYYPYNRNYNNYNNFYTHYAQVKKEEENDIKKDTVSTNTETIPFKDFKINEDKQTINTPNIEKRSGFNILGISFEIDDLIIIGVIILLFLESDKNYALIIILGLILLNVNLSDILNIF